MCIVTGSSIILMFGSYAIYDLALLRYNATVTPGKRNNLFLNLMIFGICINYALRVISGILSAGTLGVYIAKLIRDNRLFAGGTFNENIPDRRMANLSRDGPFYGCCFRVGEF